jgi:hypothetical protein
MRERERERERERINMAIDSFKTVWNNIEFSKKVLKFSFLFAICAYPCSFINNNHFILNLMFKKNFTFLFFFKFFILENSSI